MKNKKGLVSIALTLLIIFLVVILVGFILLVVKEISKPQFKITEEQCWNETQCHYTTLDGKIGFFVGDYDALTIGNETYYNICGEIMVCKDVEVEEMIHEFGENKDYYLNCSDKEDYIFYCKDQIPFNVQYKQDLTTEWLNDYCEKECIYFKEEWICNDENTHIWNWEDNNEGIRYKCDSYTVEVLK